MFLARFEITKKQSQLSLKIRIHWTASQLSMVS